MNNIKVANWQLKFGEFLLICQIRQTKVIKIFFIYSITFKSTTISAYVYFDGISDVHNKNKKAQR